MTGDSAQALFDCRDTWAATLAEVAAADERIVAVVNDSVGSSKLGSFQQEFPERTINVGIAEQDMVGIGAGLANGGRVPFVSAAGCFLSARAMEQIKVDVAYSNYAVNLVAQSPGVAYGDLGPTHHSIEDFAWMRTIPGMTVVAPADPIETAQVVKWAATAPGPVYFRVSRMGVPAVYSDDYEFVPGKAVTLREGTDVTIIGTGTTVHRALAAAEELASGGVSARVLSMPTIKPLDDEAVLAAARETGGIVTVEEALVTGLGGAVAEVLSTRHPAKQAMVGFRDTFAVTGSTSWLFELHGITREGIASTARELIA